VKLSTPLKDVLRTTEDHLAALQEMGLKTVQDLLLYFPRSHEDLSQVQQLATVPLEQKATVRGVVTGIKLVRIRGGKQLVQARFIDAEGDTAEVVWFNQPHVKRMLPDGSEVVLTGKVTERGRRLQIVSPQFEIAGSTPLVHAGRLVPVYPQHDIISTKWLREKMVLLKDLIDLLPETLPREVLDEENLPSRADAVRSLHFPDAPEDVERAQHRLAFEEMFGVQREALARKRDWQGTEQARLSIPMDVELVRAFFASLHFTPTASQKIAIYEILKDLEKPIPMSRLLEGDVGSGKTLVACTVIAGVMKHGAQCALMVPTEVLAKQHAQTIARQLIAFHSYAHAQAKEIGFPLPRVALLTGGTPNADAAAVRQGLAAGTIDVVIGTHALIEEGVVFKDLKLVIVDEQHRFGVLQRERLKQKGNPHFLSMTATPIPRTLALTAYGDHDLSVLVEKPGNRKPIRTKVVSPADRKTVELFIDREIEAGRQAFVICPLISGSEADDMLEVKSVTEESKRLREAFPHRRIAVLHGRMTPPEKEEVMRTFKERASDILVSTSVIEVGIDVPNSTIIVIEGAERFGLAQLHQFRGRVGRGDHQSHCFLFATTPEQARSPRLKAMEKHDSGFELAEIDLKIRGPGELFGVRQSGLPPLHYARFYQPELIVKARRAAEKAVR
jgi:ATP-dependent DNA helicase RecG